MRFYLVIPDRLREFRQKESAEFLKHDGSNAAAVLERLQNDKDRGPEFWKRIGNLVSKISSGTRHVSYEVMASKRPNASTDDEDAVHTLAFLQHIGRGKSQMMQALYMSDGTLRALALLLAAYQLGKHSVIAIEEPEATIHPAAAEVILQVLQDASNERQILVTTHSPDIIDSKDVTDEQIRIVGMKDGRTFISSVSKSGRAAIRDRLYTPGELLRMDELRADEEKAVEMAGDFSLFEEPDRKESGDE
jgi:predicted ATPase